MENRQTHSFLRLLCLGAVCAALTLHAMAKGERKPLPEAIILENAAAREGFLNLCGWAVTEVSTDETVIPQQWQTEAGQRWLMLQGQQGLSPEKYGGQAAKRYCYHIENIAAEGFSADVWYAELLLCGDILVGAQVYCAASPNSMQGVR